MAIQNILLLYDDKSYLLKIMIPDLYMPLSSTRHEYRGYVGIPCNIVDWRVMCFVSEKKF